MTGGISAKKKSVFVWWHRKHWKVCRDVFMMLVVVYHKRKLPLKKKEGVGVLEKGARHLMHVLSGIVLSKKEE